MASNYIQQMFVDCLSDDEIKYELTIRGMFLSSDNKLRRKNKLKSALTMEKMMQNSPEYRCDIDFAEDFEDSDKIIRIIKSIDNDDPFNDVIVKHLESNVGHMTARLKRMTPTPEREDKVKEWIAYVEEVSGKISTHYVNLPETRFNLLNNSVSNNPVEFEQDRPNNPRTEDSRNAPTARNHPRDESPPLSSTRQPHPDNPNVFNENDIVGLIERTFNTLLDRRFPNTNVRPPTQNNNRHRESFRDNNQARQNRTRNWYDDPASDAYSYDSVSEETDDYVHLRPPPRDRSRHTPPRENFDFGRPFPYPNKVNVLDWRFSFSGLDQSEDSRGLDVGSFIQKI